MQAHRKRLFLSATLAAAMLSFAACGSTASPVAATTATPVIQPITTVGQTGLGTATTAQATQSALSPTAIAQATGGPTMSLDGVSLTVARQVFAAGDDIVVTIVNNSQRTILFADHRTNCTTLTLQLQSAQGWQDVAPCKLLTATVMKQLAPGLSLDVHLGSSTQVSSQNWAPGIYRARLDFTDSGATTMISIMSPLLTITP